MSVLADDAFATGQRPAQAPRRQPTGFALLAYRINKGFRSPTPYLMLLGIGLWIFAYWLLCEGLQLPRFEKIPGPVTILSDWLSTEPRQGTSIFTPVYYEHIYVSCRRIAIAFFLATLLGVPLGLLMGWSKTIKDYTFPVLETLRPIPIMAWVPLAILMFSGYETPVIFLATLASFFATTLNTMLGVQSIDESYFRAAGCLGSKKWDVFRHVVVPGALPFIFTGLQISVGVAWFSLVAAEMVSGDFGLGYLILSSYVNSVTVPMVIGMLTLGFVGWFSSALVRWVGNRLMQWHVKALAMQGR
ncbi:ABC transporter permease [Hansschlegelia sp.]|uniref:ABC transporter permease n=1 Tax=Hansschlegelia sp. TaxID=2041892 RepID=UPI002B8FFF17|nr:ABC transporter permease [Hansschlegelia sp.]HVI27983.1 ABC transporter permease [Hansschlegelia sp.]